MKEFDLAKALAGDPMKLIGDSDLLPKWIIAKSKYHNDRYIIEDKHGAYTLSLDDIQEGFEMYEEPRPTVTLTLPAPIKTAHHNQEVFKRGNSTIIRFYFDANRDKHRKILESGSLFYSEEDAQAWLDAMKSARR